MQASYAVRFCAIAGFASACALIAAERTVAPSFLHRHLPGLEEKKADISTSSCHYKPVFGAGDSEARVARGVARFGEVTIDPGGLCAVVDYPREEQIYVVLDGSGSVRYGDEKHPVNKLDYMYLPPGISHGIVNSSQTPLRVIVMGWRLPDYADTQSPHRENLVRLKPGSDLSMHGVLWNARKYRESPPSNDFVICRLNRRPYRRQVF
ncbi:MAG: cupin domain-containing protein, partial [bacterium]|nr:cupin domain-containing protein [bacterium]